MGKLFLAVLLLVTQPCVSQNITANRINTVLFTSTTSADIGADINALTAVSCPAPTWNDTNNLLTGGSCEIDIPAGTYSLSTPIHAITGLKINGAGRGVTIIKAVAGLNKSMILVGTNSTETGANSDSAAFVEISDLTLDGNASNQTVVGYLIHVGNGSRDYFHDLKLQNGTSHAIVIDNGSLARQAASSPATNGNINIYDNDFTAAQSGFRNDNAGVAPVAIYCWGCSDPIIYGNTANDFNLATNISYAGVYLRDSGDVQFQMNQLSWGQTASLIVYGTLNNIIVANNTFPGVVGKYGIWLPRGTSCSQCKITNNIILNASAGASYATLSLIEIDGTSNGNQVAVDGNILTVTSCRGSNPNGITIAPSGVASNTVTFGVNQISIVSGSGIPISNTASVTVPSVAPVLCSTSQKAETSADPSVLSCAIPAQAGSYRLRFVLSLASASSATLGWTATWADSAGNVQTPTNLSLFQSGSEARALTFTTSAAGNYYGEAQIDVNNAGITIVIKLTFSGTSLAGKVSATVERMI